MNNKRVVFVGLLLIVSASMSCVTWRAPKTALYKGIHQLPTMQKQETIALKASDKDDGLARVIVIPFTNQTKSNSYDYLSESLSSAIDAGMASRFEYKRKVVAEQKEFIMRLQFASDRRVLITEFAKQYEIDIVISGYYANAGAGKLSIQTEVFESGKTQNLAEFSELSKADSSLFTVSDQIAKKTVEAIVQARR
ncbi:MAG: hypothetical protein U1F16_03080 [Turneriella sp.]